MKDQKEIKKIISIIIISKRIKYLGINLPMGQKNYIPKTKTLMKEIKEDTPMETIFMDWKTQYCQNDRITQGNLQIQCNLYQITNGIFCRSRTKKILKFI